MKNTTSTRPLFWGALSLYFLFIGYEALTSGYLFAGLFLYESLIKGGSQPALLRQTTH